MEGHQRGYESFECISAINGTDLDKFHDLVKHYSKQLCTNLSNNGSVYTMHDFGHHCIDLYKIVSRVILNCNSAYNNGNGMKSREFYILNIAILLHDIGMNKVIDMNRGKHSYDSADFIKKEYNICSSPLAEEQSGLTRNEIAGLRRIVQAHSDGNDPSVPNCERGLNNPKIQENLNGKEVIIREKLLAFILRLADELDVTSDRIGHSSIEEELENAEERCQDILYKLSVCNHDEKELPV